MSDSNGNERGFDGRDFATVLLTLGGVGGYLWLDHKLTLERKVATDLSKEVALLLAGGASVSPPAAPVSALPRLPAPPAPTRAPSNASYAVRLPRLALAPRTYDDVFARCGRGLPISYLRALALHESDMRPRLADGPAWGLLQVIEVVREDHNRRERANYTRPDLLDPAINATIAASAIALIAKSYATNHPSSRNMATDWRNPQFVALVTYGWNAGWSERAGVGRVASYLEQRGVEVNINAVFDAAKAAGASPHLWNPAKLAWCKLVTRQYFVELADEERVIEIEASPPKREPGERPAVVVDVSSAPSHPDDSPEEHPVLVVGVSSVPAHPDDSPGPITSPWQVEHEPAHPDAVAGPVAPPIAGPPMFTPPIQTHPSGGSGPVDPYGEEMAPHGYPEDPYAYNYAPGGAPHA
jgi:hypothetical protein